MSIDVEECTGYTQGPIYLERVKVPTGISPRRFLQRLPGGGGGVCVCEYACHRCEQDLDVQSDEERVRWC